jgi:hypothetical protein
MYSPQASWTKCLHHVTGQHEWIDVSGYTDGHCEHPAIAEDESHPSLEPTSPTVDALRDVIWDKKLLKNMDYYRNYR